MEEQSLQSIVDVAHDPAFLDQFLKKNIFQYSKR